MAAGAVKGTFALNTTTGNQTVDTGVGSTLKALWLWGTTGQTADGFAAGQSGFVGMAVSSTMRAVLAWASDDNLATTNMADGYTNALCLRQFSGGTPTVDAEADFVDFTTGGAGRFTINVTNAPAVAHVVHYYAVYGADITNAEILQFTAKTLTTGTQDDTGYSFQGDVLFSLGQARTAVGNTAGIKSWMGAAVSTSQRGAMYWGGRDGMTPGAGIEEHYSKTTACCTIPVAQGNAIDAAADFSAWLSNGYQWNWTDFAASAWLYSTLVIKGGQWEIDTILAPSATGNQDVTTAFDPLGVLFFGTGRTTADATEAVEMHAVMGAGAGATLVEGHIWTSEDDVVNTDANRRNNTTKCIGAATNPSTVTCEADLTLGTAKYTLNWTTTLLNSRFFGLAVGSNAGGGGGAGGANKRKKILDMEMFQRSIDWLGLGLALGAVTRLARPLARRTLLKTVVALFVRKR